MRKLTFIRKPKESCLHENHVDSIIIDYRDKLLAKGTMGSKLDAKHGIIAYRRLFVSKQVLTHTHAHTASAQLL